MSLASSIIAIIINSIQGVTGHARHTSGVDCTPKKNGEGSYKHMLYLFSLMRYIEFCKQSKPITNVEIVRFEIGQDYKEIRRTPGTVRV